MASAFLNKNKSRGRIGHRRVHAAAVAAVLLLPAVPAVAWPRAAVGDTDDLLLSARRRVLVEPVREPSCLSTAGAWLGSTVSAVSSAASAPVSALTARLSDTSAALNQFTWELAYAFGVNSTPASRVFVTDSVGEAGEKTAANAPAEAPPEAPEPPPPALPATVAPPVPPPAPAAIPAVSVPASPPAPPPVPVSARLLAELAVDKPQRRPDGSYFVPKPLQRLFDIHTLKVESTQTPLTTRLSGRIVPDPNAHGDVEASLLGRIEPPKTGLPVLGEVVKKGQVLGYVTPAIGVVDRSQVRREVARLTNEIRITAEGLELLKQFWFVPFRDGKVMQTEVRLDGLRRERAALLPMLQTQEVLRAAVDGIISVSNAINGRIVHPGEKIFEIVNPRQLWVEAVAPDPEVARSASLVENATASTPEGEVLGLSFIGSGLALQQQSVPLMFRIEDPIQGLRVGRPVSVTVRNGSKLRQGMPIPREALVTDSGGAEQVWEMMSPETFMPHTVKTEALDGRSVLIVAGVGPGARIVTSGARLLSQFQ